MSKQLNLIIDLLRDKDKTNKDFKRCWILRKAEDLFDNIKENQIVFDKMIPQAFDFTTLYTKLPHDKIFENMGIAIQEAWDYFRSLGITAATAATYAELQSPQILMEYVHFIVSNIFIANDEDHVLRQCVGIPMGTNCAPEIANLVLYVYEARYIDSLRSNGRIEEAMKHKFTRRFIDDIITFNTEPIPKEAYDNLEYSKQINDDIQGETSVIYLGAKITHREGKRMQISVFDKAKEWKFKVLRYPSAQSNTPQHQTRGIYIGELRRYQLMVNSIFAFKQAASSLTRNMYIRGNSMRDIKQAWSAFMLKYGRFFYSLRKEQQLRNWFRRMVRWAFHPTPKTRTSSTNRNRIATATNFSYRRQVSSQLNRNTNNISRNTHIILPPSQISRNGGNRRERRERETVHGMMTNRSDRGTSRHTEVDEPTLDALIMANRHITSTVTAQYYVDNNFFQDSNGGSYGEEGVSLQSEHSNRSGREEEGIHESQQSQSDSDLDRTDFEEHQPLLDSSDNNDTEDDQHNIRSFPTRRIPRRNDDTSDSEASLESSDDDENSSSFLRNNRQIGRTTDNPINSNRRITRSQAARIGGNDGFNGNGGNGQIPPVVRPVEVRRNNRQATRRRTETPSENSSTSTTEEIVDNRPITLNRADTPTTTIGAEREQKLQSIRDGTFTEPRVKLFYYNASITPHPNNLEDDRNVENVWTYDLALRCQKNKIGFLNAVDKSFENVLRNRIGKSTNLLSSSGGNLKFFCPICWIQLAKDDHKPDVCRNYLRFREAAIQYARIHGLPRHPAQR